MPFAAADIAHAEIQPGWWLSADRALYFAEERTLAVADIHWGYAFSHRRVGNLLPMVGNEEIALRLRRLLQRYAPQRMIWLGDSLHTPAAAEFAERFLEEIPEVEVIVVKGNHDRAWPRADRQDFRLGRIVFHHGDRSYEIGPDEIEVIGTFIPPCRGATARGCG